MVRSNGRGADLYARHLIVVQGNGVYLAGYNRDASIASSELTMIGDSPIALWGWTKSNDPLLPPGTVRQTVDFWLTGCRVAYPSD
eukprot:COSAG02_NODE_1558_length_11928_cov_4.044974_10_plen_85_part_00